MATGSKGSSAKAAPAPKAAAPAPKASSASKPTAPAAAKPAANSTLAAIKASDRKQEEKAAKAAQKPTLKDYLPSKSQSALSKITGQPAPFKANTVGPLKSGYVTQKKAAELQKKAIAKYDTPKTKEKKNSVPPPSAKKPVVKKPVVKKPEVVSTPKASEEVSPEPSTSYESTPVTSTPPVKSAPIDTVVFIDDAIGDEIITDLLFEDVGGQELLTIARSDTVNGQDVIYQPFKNLNILQETYNPTNLLMLQETSDKFFANFVIDFREKIPSVGNGINGKNYYVDPNTGDLILEFINMRPDEQVEFQISTAGIINDVGI